MPQGRSRGGTGTRPTTDRVRESVFNVLAARLDFEGIRVLDLYAGSGALGLEAVSRGAAAATFVEADRRAADVIARNAADLGAIGVDIRCATVRSIVSAPAPAAADLVFADPPYEVSTAEVVDVVAALAGAGWAGDGTIAVVERPASAPPLDWPRGWTGWKPRTYGDTRVEFGESEPIA